MGNEVNVSNTALAVTFLGVIAGILFSIVWYRLKGSNQRFVEKCRREGTYTKAEVVKELTFYDNRSYKSKSISTKYLVTYEYAVKGKTYRKKAYVQATDNWGGYNRYPTIYYNKNNPKKAKFAKQKNPAGGCFLGFVLAIVIMLAAVKLFP